MLAMKGEADRMRTPTNSFVYCIDNIGLSSIPRPQRHSVAAHPFFGYAVSNHIYICYLLDQLS